MENSGLGSNVNQNDEGRSSVVSNETQGKFKFPTGSDLPKLAEISTPNRSNKSKTSSKISGNSKKLNAAEMLLTGGQEEVRNYDASDNEEAEAAAAAE